MVLDRRSFVLGTLGAGLFCGKGFAGEALADTASRLASGDNIPLIAVAALDGGELSRSFLVSGTSNPLPAGAVFQAASLAKPMVALLTLRLVQEQKLQLDRPVDQFLPGGYPHRQNIFAINATPVVDLVPASVLRQITPRMLLSHTAGFPNWSASGPLVPDYEPGSRWQYSGEGYVLLQRILEVVSGLDLQPLADEILFQPLGLARTAFKITDAIKPYLVPGAPRNLRFPYEIASSSLYTTADDYARFVANVLKDEKLVALISATPVMLPTSWRDFFRSSHPAWGLGWGLEVQEIPISFWHWGSNPGFRSLVMADLKTHDAIVVLTSSEQGMAAAKTLVEAQIPGEHPGLSLGSVQ